MGSAEIDSRENRENRDSRDYFVILEFAVVFVVFVVPIVPIFPIMPMPLPTSISALFFVKQDCDLSRERNFLLEGVRFGLSQKGAPEDSTRSTASGAQLFGIGRR